MIEAAICILTVPLSVVVGEEQGKKKTIQSANKAAASYLLKLFRIHLRVLLSLPKYVLAVSLQSPIDDCSFPN